MLKLSKKLILALGVCALVGAMMTADEAQARPAYPKFFVGKYENMAGEVEKVKCGVCHPVMDKKVRNDYGMAIGKSLGEEKNVKEPAFIKALDAAAKEKNADGKAFGDLIKDGKLPGKAAE